MSRTPSQGTGLLVVSLSIAAVLQVLPIFGELAMWRPHFVLLVLTFFLLYQPLNYGIATAWLVGLVLDVLYGGVFGRYALGLGVCAYLLQLLRRRLSHARVWHQCGLVLLLVAASQLIVVSVNLLTHNTASWAAIWYPALSSALIWPLVHLTMMRLRKRAVRR